MPAHAGPGRYRLKCCGDETQGLLDQGLSLKQYGAQRLSLLPVIPQGEFFFISCFFTHMLSPVQVSSEC